MSLYNTMQWLTLLCIFLWSLWYVVFALYSLFTYKLKWLDSTTWAAQDQGGCGGKLRKAKLRRAKSVLSQAVHYDHIHLLQNSVLHRIVEEKWKAYGQRYAAVEATLAAVHLVLITASIGLRPTNGNLSTIMM